MNTLHATDLKAFVQAQRDAGAPPPLLLDVREPWEVQLAPLATAECATLHIPMNDVPGRLAELQGHLVDSQPIVCFCHHGMRSAQVVAFLLHQGQTLAYNLAGGTEAWSNEVDPSVPRY